ncbi:NAD(P)-dependent oxidoreductase [Plectonema cf. radiosum LEGE 06105]|uniref:NAD(P)-dependent oxidoreductase n=1 Tax=Plectonema cf. radiosum LEGE 06105 TaxID=945769 RepID=A0A8J7JUE0_9CYAN|nr:NAD(P)-dependent oxidoreductase [Plectonema radiosum]MBE9213310.1 NAD(P)-dependent oxidoreductase [Plectonema cf. radiosum LEGE 06105]
MKLLVTGASGFLGKYTVAEALGQGFQVRAVIRHTSDEKRLPWRNCANLELIPIDLTKLEKLEDALKGIDTVVHLAAAKQGNYDTQYANTVIATENLLQAMLRMNIKRLVAISTFSVFDYLHIPAYEIINEDSAIESQPTRRDIYAQTKLIQESLFRDFEQKNQGEVTILRPGIVYGRNNLWNAHLGINLKNRLWINIGGNAQLPLTYVENCAQAIVNVCGNQEAIGKTLNIIDNDLPTQKVYRDKILKLLSHKPSTVGIDWRLIRLLSHSAWFFNKVLFLEKIKLPGILIPARLEARFKPFRYSNKNAEQVLNWQPKYSLDQALKRSCSDVDLLGELTEATSLSF